MLRSDAPTIPLYASMHYPITLGHTHPGLKYDRALYTHTHTYIYIYICVCVCVVQPLTQSPTDCTRDNQRELSPSISVATVTPGEPFIDLFCRIQWARGEAPGRHGSQVVCTVEERAAFSIYGLIGTYINPYIEGAGLSSTVHRRVLGCSLYIWFGIQ